MAILVNGSGSSTAVLGQGNKRRREREGLDLTDLENLLISCGFETCHVNPRGLGYLFFNRADATPWLPGNSRNVPPLRAAVKEYVDYYKVRPNRSVALVGYSYGAYGVSECLAELSADEAVHLGAAVLLGCPIALSDPMECADGSLGDEVPILQHLAEQTPLAGC